MRVFNLNGTEWAGWNDDDETRHDEHKDRLLVISPFVIWAGDKQDQLGLPGESGMALKRDIRFSYGNRYFIYGICK